MTLELIKETKWNGDVYFYILKEGSRVENSTIYAGTINEPEIVARIEQEALQKLEKFQGDTSILKIIKSIEI